VIQVVNRCMDQDACPQTPEIRNPEESSGSGDPERANSSALKIRLSRLMLIRLALLTLLLAANLLLATRTQTAEESFDNLYLLIGLLFAMSAAYLFWLRTSKRLLTLARTQVYVDLGVVTAFVFLTGGAASIFQFLYVLAIISGAMMLGRRAAFICAGVGCILYGLVVNLQFYNLIPPFYLEPVAPRLNSTSVLINLVTHFSAFFGVALLTSHLSTQLSRVQQALKEKTDDVFQLEALNDWILESIESGLVTVNKNGRILSWNAAAERILGYSAAEALERSLESFFPEFMPLPSSEEDSRSTGRNHRREATVERKDGKTVHLGFSLSPLLSPEGQYHGTTIILQDITEVKLYQARVERLERLAVLGRLAAGMAHEIRNPLGSMSGALQMLRQGQADPELSARLMAIIHREMARLNDLLNEYLWLSKPQKPPLAAQRLDPLPILDETLTLLNSKLNLGSNVLFEKEVVPGSRLPFAGDHFRQILWNLLLNAVEASDYRGTIGIRIGPAPSESHHERDPGSRVYIEVRDEGEGMASDTVQQIFEPFFTTRSTGTGLGLTLVQATVENYGGTIEADSAPGKGTTFRITVPLD